MPLLFCNSLSSSSMLILVVTGFNITALSTDVRARLTNSVSSTTLSSRIGTVTISVEMVAPKVRVTVVSVYSVPAGAIEEICFHQGAK